MKGVDEAQARLIEEPVLAVCGFSGAGKTTLIETVVPLLRCRGLAVAVVKHDAHGLDVDHPGKDSDRLFRAGADVLLRGPGERVARWHGEGGLEDAVLGLLGDHDLVLVEGHKTTPLRKIWLGDGPPEGVGNVIASLPGGAGRGERLLAVVDELLAATLTERQLMAGILIGGGSTRMGRPKHLIEVEGITLLDRIARALEPLAGRPVLLGAGELPAGWGDAMRLPDPPGAAGPAAGILAAMSWAPRTAWVIASCDLPTMVPAAVEWLLAQRRPGRWAVLPRLDGVRPEPTLAVYEPPALRLIEAAVRAGGGPSRLAGHGSVGLVDVPAPLRASWRDADTPEDLR